MRGLSAVLLVLACAVTPPGPQATTLLHLNLSEMAGRADRIFRGTVIEVESGTARVGGIDLPTLEYTFEVGESFAGEYTVVKGRKLVEIRMLGKIPEVRVGNAVRVSSLPEMPPLEQGGDYLLFTTLPGGSGLSAPVGLGQGWFRLSGDPGDEQAVNGFDNVGLFSHMNVRDLPDRGPIGYALLADRIRAVLDRQ